jgi:hypothetical protein
MAAMSNFLENKIIDQIFRGQAYSFPTTLYVGLFTAAPTDTGGGTEVSGGDYARASVAASLANFAGTQGAGTTSASSGDTGTTSNNASITFVTPGATWGTVSGFGVFDAATGGNLLFYGTLSISKTINQGDTVTFPAASLSVQIDN